MAPDDLPHVDELVVDVAAPPAAAWPALLDVLRDDFGRTGGCRVQAGTRAAFPGPHGGLYRPAVIGSDGHAVVTGRMLAAVARGADDPARAAR